MVAAAAWAVWAGWVEWICNARGMRVLLTKFRGVGLTMRQGSPLTSSQKCVIFGAPGSAALPTSVVCLPAIRAF